MNLIRLVRLVLLIIWLVEPRAAAQTAAELNIQIYAGLTVVGEIGKVYPIEYVTDLTDPAESDWRCLEYLQLLSQPVLVG